MTLHAYQHVLRCCCSPLPKLELQATVKFSYVGIASVASFFRTGSGDAIAIRHRTAAATGGVPCCHRCRCRFHTGCDLPVIETFRIINQTIIIGSDRRSELECKEIPSFRSVRKWPWVECRTQSTLIGLL